MLQYFCPCSVQCVWIRNIYNCLSICLGDGSTRTWDIRTGHVTNVIPTFSGEILSCDWTKYDSVRSLHDIYPRSFLGVSRCNKGHEDNTRTSS